MRAEGEGYLTGVRGDALIAAAREQDALVVQRADIGAYVAPRAVLAEVRCRPGAACDELCDVVRGAFSLGTQRSPVSDAAFPIRQLADIGLKGLSPGINDPTTAENAMDACTSLLVRAATEDRASALRADEDGVVRFVARAPDLDDLVRLAFEQVRVFAAPYPVMARHLLTLLPQIEDAAAEAGVPCGETARQAALIAQGPDGEVPTDADANGVRAVYAQHWRAASLG